MQSFHHSRGRILFEVLCALGISASCVGAWMQTGASALLAAASVSALYGLVHLFDMRGRKPAVAAELQPVARARKPETAVPAELKLTAETSVEQVEKVDPPAPKATRARKTKAAPKASRRRANTRDVAKVAEVVPPEEANVTEVVSLEEPNVVALTPPEEPKVVELVPPQEPKAAEPSRFEDVPAPTAPPAEETTPIPLTPLFDPKPFVRQQRAAFGRKA